MMGEVVPIPTSPPVPIVIATALLVPSCSMSVLSVPISSASAEVSVYTSPAGESPAVPTIPRSAEAVAPPCVRYMYGLSLAPSLSVSASSTSVASVVAEETVRRPDGEVVPIPTFPASSIVNAVVLFVLNISVPVACLFVSVKLPPDPKNPSRPQFVSSLSAHSKNPTASVPVLPESLIIISGVLLETSSLPCGVVSPPILTLPILSTNTPSSPPSPERKLEPSAMFAAEPDMVNVDEKSPATASTVPVSVGEIENTESPVPVSSSKAARSPAELVSSPSNAVSAAETE